MFCIAVILGRWKLGKDEDEAEEYNEKGSYAIIERKEEKHGTVQKQLSVLMGWLDWFELLQINWRRGADSVSQWIESWWM